MGYVLFTETAISVSPEGYGRSLNASYTSIKQV